MCYIYIDTEDNTHTLTSLSVPFADVISDGSFGTIVLGMSVLTTIVFVIVVVSLVKRCVSCITLNDIYGSVFYNLISTIVLYSICSQVLCVFVIIVSIKSWLLG